MSGPVSQQRQPVGLFDSGIGGLTVANAIAEYLPAESLLYYGDTAHVPYGPQSQDMIRSYSVHITRFLIDRGCKLIVVACNTATAAALPALRQTWPDVPFVGMEPAVKPAARATRTGKVGVLATRGTFQSERYRRLMELFGRHVEVWEDPCLGLVELIEAGQHEHPDTKALLRSVLSPMLRQKVDTFVLGCTHYPLVKSLILSITGPGATVIDPAPAVARQVERLLRDRNCLSPQKEAPDQFFASGDGASLSRTATALLHRSVTVQPLPVFP